MNQGDDRTSVWADDGTQPSAVGWSQDDHPDTPMVHDGHCEEDCEECDSAVLRYVTNAPNLIETATITIDGEPVTRQISAGMDDGLEVWAKCGCEVVDGDSECKNCRWSGEAENEFVMGDSIEKVAEFDAKQEANHKKVEVAAAIRAVEKKVAAPSQGSILASEAKAKAGALIDKHVSFMQWCGKHLDETDSEEQERQATEYLVEKIMRSKTEDEKTDWESVYEMFIKANVDFKEKTREKLASLSTNDAPALKTAQQIATEVRFNGFLAFFVIIPKEWWAGMNGAKAKMAKVKTQRIYDCSQFAIPPHKDEVVQMNPQLAIEKDKAFAECWLQYEKVLNKAMPFLNGPCTSDIVFLNGMISKPMMPGMPAAKLGNVKKMADESKLDNCMIQLCIQFLPHVIYLEFLPDTRDGSEVMKDKQMHMNRMGFIEQFCTDHNMFERRLATLKQAAGGSIKQ